jgi:hypothetical protein
MHPLWRVLLVTDDPELGNKDIAVVPSKEILLDGRCLTVTISRHKWLGGVGWGLSSKAL